MLAVAEFPILLSSSIVSCTSIKRFVDSTNSLSERPKNQKES